MRIAVVGAGIAGLSSAWLLRKQGHAITVFEAEPRLGGHTHTLDVTLEGLTHPVDTGFLVFNDQTYPNLIALFEELGVRSVASEMSFSVRNDSAGIEWAGSGLAALFAQPANALVPAFWRMLADIVRFNRTTCAMVASQAVPDVTIAEHLERERFSRAFRDWYLLPMAAAIWSSPQRDILAFPLPTFVQFCHNHGLLQVTDRPQWRTVAGGGREYVRRIAATLDDVRLGSPVLAVRRKTSGVEIDSLRRHAEGFDAIVLACHSDQALAVLGDDASTEERSALSRIRYQKNRVLLHTDPSLLPRRRAAWSAWNYLAVEDPRGERPVAVSYLINRLQPLPFKRPLLVTLNPPFEPDSKTILGEFEYSHPLLDAEAIRAQSAFALLQGERRTWFAGAWLGHGFHEDGIRSGHAVAASISTYANELDDNLGTQREAA